MIGSENGLTAIGAHFFVAAVMEENHVATAYLFFNFSFDHCRRRSVPVVAGDIPHDGLEAKLSRDAQDSGAASSERRAEETGMLANGVLNGRAAVGEFLTDFGGAFEGQ